MQSIHVVVFFCLDFLFCFCFFVFPCTFGATRARGLPHAKYPHFRVFYLDFLLLLLFFRVAVYVCGDTGFGERGAFSAGASFGEVELLRADGSTAPRLATCRCLGRMGQGDGECEALVMRGHTFAHLTDVFHGVRARLGAQVGAGIDPSMLRKR